MRSDLMKRAAWGLLAGIGVSLLACTAIISSGDITGQLEDGCELADSNEITISRGDLKILQGSTVGSPAKKNPSKNPSDSCPHADGPERIYRVKPMAPGILTARLVPAEKRT